MAIRNITFNKDQLKFLEDAFPRITYNPSEEGFINKLIMREGQYQVINKIKQIVDIKEKENTHVFNRNNT